MTASYNNMAFFDALATEMNEHPEIYEVLGDVDMRIALVMRGEHDFRVLLTFDGITCAGVSMIGAGDERVADCWLEGDREAWDEMFDNILANGHATGRQTINSLTLLGDRIAARGDDPLGVDKFFRFNQTVQAFLDGAAAVRGSVAAAT